MLSYGFLRAAAAVPHLRVADCAFNAERTASLMRRAEALGVAVLVFPEMGLTGYTCGDLFHQAPLQRAALDALERVRLASGADFRGLVTVGLPLAIDDQLFNCAAVLHRGRVLGVVPKFYLPTYKEFYDARYFSSGATARSRAVQLLGQTVPFGNDLLFEAADVGGLTYAVEVCEDLWGPSPPSSLYALHGATVVANLSASNETIAKADYRRQLVGQQSARCLCAYVYAGAGGGESTTDLVFGGHCLLAENGNLLAESPRFAREETLTAADFDLERLRHERVLTNSFSSALLYPGLRREFRRVAFRLAPADPPPPLLRAVDAHPFVPAAGEELRGRCEEIFHIQVGGLARRLEHLGVPRAAIGVSGGLDSTLALLVACRTADALGGGREKIHALTMPGFGTTGRTRGNALKLMRALGVTAREIDIRPLCLEEMRRLGHRPFGIDLTGLDAEGLAQRLRELPPERLKEDLTFENVQARMRTSLLMNTGFVIGTGDLSELALGWCTYNGDHMSMYNPNVGVPKTLVKFLVEWAARNEFDGEVRETLLDIVATRISPELLPPGAGGESAQETEAVIGPYELHDFFLFHFLRYGMPPEKILFLASRAEFDRDYDPDEVRHWLRVFLTRFFANQFKRSCLPGGPKVGSVSRSPRGGWRVPSDAGERAWRGEDTREQRSGCPPGGHASGGAQSC